METNQIHGSASFLHALLFPILFAFFLFPILFSFFFLSSVSHSVYYYCKHGHALLSTEEAPKKKRHEGLVSLWDFSQWALISERSQCTSTGLDNFVRCFGDATSSLRILPIEQQYKTRQQILFKVLPPMPERQAPAHRSHFAD